MKLRPPYTSDRNQSVSSAKLSKDTNATRYLSNEGTSNNPHWDQINVANGITGTVPEANGGTALTSLAKLTWSPSFTATGTGTPTWGTVTTYRADYFQLGKLVCYNIAAEGTTGGSTVTQLNFTLPITAVSEADSFTSACTEYHATDNHRATACRNSSTTVMAVSRFDNGDFGIGANRAIRAEGCYFAA